MVMDMTEFFAENLIRAESLEEGKVYEATILRVNSLYLRGKIQPVIWFEDEFGIVLNQTRLRALIFHYGVDGDLWIGKVVRYRRGQTMLQNLPAPTIEIVSPEFRLQADE